MANLHQIKLNFMRIAWKTFNIHNVSNFIRLHYTIKISRRQGKEYQSIKDDNVKIILRKFEDDIIYQKLVYNKKSSEGLFGT